MRNILAALLTVSVTSVSFAKFPPELPPIIAPNLDVPHGELLQHPDVFNFQGKFVDAYPKTEPESPPPFIVIVGNDNKMKIITDKKEEGFGYVWSFDRYFPWEDFNSAIYLTNKKDLTQIELSLNTRSTGWVKVELIQTNLEFSFRFWNTDFPAEAKKSWTFPDFKQALQSKDKEFMIVLSNALIRCQQRWPVLNKAMFEAIEKAPSKDFTEQVKQEMLVLIKQLDDKNYKVRDKATEALGQPKYGPYLFEIAKELKLTPEQSLRVNRIINCFDFVMTPSLKEPLKKELNKD